MKKMTSYISCSIIYYTALIKNSFTDRYREAKRKEKKKNIHSEMCEYDMTICDVAPFYEQTICIDDLHVAQKYHIEMEKTIALY